MVELVEFIAKSLVDDSSSVAVEEVTETDGNIIINLSVAEEDMGKIIGKQGRIAKSIRAILKAISLKENKKITLNIKGSMD